MQDITDLDMHMESSILCIRATAVIAGLIVLIVVCGSCLVLIVNNMV